MLTLASVTVRWLLPLLGEEEEAEAVREGRSSPSAMRAVSSRSLGTPFMQYSIACIRSLRAASRLLRTWGGGRHTTRTHAYAASAADTRGQRLS